MKPKKLRTEDGELTVYNGPMYLTPKTFRNYEDYRYEEARTKGWNDAIDFIFKPIERTE